MDLQPKVSVIIPVQGSNVTHLKQRLDSAIAQTLKDIEIICVCAGGSAADPAVGAGSYTANAAFTSEGVTANVACGMPGETVAMTAGVKSELADTDAENAAAALVSMYAEADPRVRIIAAGAEAGYEDLLNRGIEAAKGEYTGMILPGSFAAADMYEKLYELASANAADAVRCGSVWHDISADASDAVDASDASGVANVCSNTETGTETGTEPGVETGSETTGIPVASPAMDKRIICPRTDLKAKLEMSEFFSLRPLFGSAIYRTDFLRDNGIYFSGKCSCGLSAETRPETFTEDTAFVFKIMGSADRLQLVKEAYMHYYGSAEQAASDGSDTPDAGTIFGICDVYADIEAFLSERPVIYSRLEYVKNRLKFDAYMKHYEGLGSRYRYIFLERFAEELSEDFYKGLLDRGYFKNSDWELVEQIEEDPAGYYTYRQLKEQAPQITLADFNAVLAEINSRKAQERSGGRAAKLKKSLKDHGLLYTIVMLIKKVFRWLGR